MYSNFGVMMTTADGGKWERVHVCEYKMFTARHLCERYSNTTPGVLYAIVDSDEVYHEFWLNGERLNVAPPPEINVSDSVPLKTYVSMKSEHTEERFDIKVVIGATYVSVGHPEYDDISVQIDFFHGHPKIYIHGDDFIESSEPIVFTITKDWNALSRYWKEFYDDYTDK